VIGSRSGLTATSAAIGAAVALLGTGCGSQEIAVPKRDPTYQGALLFNQRCSGCHTLDVAASQGSKPPEQQNAGGERTNGPNFNLRKEDPQSVLFAIRNGGFSGAIMPANVVVGPDADKVAAFVAKYAGKGGVPPESN
jgi:mono/diheme cytochrome c family protein